MTRSSLFILIAAVAFAGFVFWSARKRQLSERFSLGWLLVCGVVAALAIWRSWIDELAALLGIFYAPSALFLIALGAVFIALYRVTLDQAEQRRKLERLAQDIALMRAPPPPES